MAGLALALPLPAFATSGDDETLKKLPERFARLDRDGDGRVTMKEVERARRGCFRHADQNRDSHLNIHEFAHMVKNASRSVADRRFARIDTNDDQRLSYAEFMARPVRLFGLYDSNGDGGLTLAEARFVKRGIE